MRRRMLVGALVVVLLSGCATGAGSGGGRAQPITLTAWSSEKEDRPSGVELTTFVEAVAKRSDGRITIAPTYGMHTGPNPDQTVIEAVQKGSTAIGLVASRAFSSEKVLTFRALTVPFLIQTNDQADAVAADPSVTAPMLAGLSGAGMTGLAVLPETIRHPFGVKGKPVLGSADYTGKVVRSLTSDETYAMFRALGAKPGFWDSDEFQQRLDAGAIDIVESSFELAMSVMGRPAVATGNVAFFPRMNVLFANTAALADLSDADKEVLRQAAADARAAAAAAVTPDAEAGAAYCKEGGQVVLASDAEVGELRRLVAPYIDTLDADPGTRSVIDAVRRTIAATPASSPPVVACGNPVGGPVATQQPWALSTAPTPLDGRYRLEIRDADLTAIGTPPAEVPVLHGQYTWTIRDGVMTVDQLASPTSQPMRETWRLAIQGHRAMLIQDTGSETPTAENVTWVGTWSIDPSTGDLSFTDFVAGKASAPSDRVLWFSKPAQRLG